MTNQELLTTFGPVAFVLNRLNIPFYVGGSVAGLVHGITRQPNDIDLCADFRHNHLTNFTQQLQQDYYIGNIGDALIRGIAFNVISYITSEKVDIFPLGHSMFERDCLFKANSYLWPTNPPVTCKVEAAEGVILHKLKWSPGSSFQISDVVEIMKAASPNLNWNYLNSVAANLGCFAELNQARLQAGV